MPATEYDSPEPAGDPTIFVKNLTDASNALNNAHRSGKFVVRLDTKDGPALIPLSRISRVVEG